MKKFLKNKALFVASSIFALSVTTSSAATFVKVADLTSGHQARVLDAGTIEVSDDLSIAKIKDLEYESRFFPYGKGRIDSITIQLRSHSEGERLSYRGTYNSASLGTLHAEVTGNLIVNLHFKNHHTILQLLGDWADIGNTSVIFDANTTYDALMAKIPALAEVEDGLNRPADINGDGMVDFSDFLALSTNYGKSVTSRSEGDLDGNGIVNFADFVILSTYWF